MGRGLEPFQTQGRLKVVGGLLGDARNLLVPGGDTPGCDHS